MGKRFAILCALSTLALSACVKEEGNCNLADGGTVKTYKFGGSWKKISGYGATKPDLIEEYDILVIEPRRDGTTGSVCVAKVKDGVVYSVAFRGQYTLEESARKAALTVTEGDVPGTTLTYRFAGSCKDTKMTLSYQGTTPKTEDYQLRNTTVAIGSCNPSTGEEGF